MRTTATVVLFKDKDNDNNSLSKSMESVYHDDWPFHVQPSPLQTQILSWNPGISQELVPTR